MRPGAGADRRGRPAHRHLARGHRRGSPQAQVDLPEGFTAHPRLLPQLQKRVKMLEDATIDWAMGETLAYGSLLLEGRPVRLAGQDARRGTFGHRHAVIVDRATGDEHTPLAQPVARPGAVLRLRLAAVRVRRDGLRVRLLGRPSRRARALGGAVRRLRQRRHDDRRRVHRRRRGEVGAALRPDAAAAARLRGPGPRPLVGPRRALPAAVRRGQHGGGGADDARQLLPPAAPAGPAVAQAAAGGPVAEVDAAPAGGLLGRRGLHRHGLRAGARRPRRAGPDAASSASC